MKRFFWLSACAIGLIVASTAHSHAQRGQVVPQMRGDGPPPEAKPFSITKNDPALDDIIAPDAQLVELARGFGLTEGGLWIAEGNSGYWIFAGLLDNVIYKVTPQKQVSVFMEKAGYTGTDPESKLRISIIANYYDQFVREGGRWKFKRHQIGGTPPAASSGSK